MTGITIGGRSIGTASAPLIVAEMSGNHNGSLDRALTLLDAAAACGAHALKIQTYTADTMTLDIKQGEFVVSDPASPWGGRSLYDVYRQAYTPWEWHGPIFDKCRSLGLIGFSTPFDDTAVDFLESLGVPCYKIASFENTDIRLIRRVAATGKPMFISTGMATVSELDESVRAARDAGCPDVVLLKCTSTYPALAENTNLLTIPHMRELFQCEVGLSDHTMGIGVAVASVALGATVIEKHFTLRRADGGVDAEFSLEPEELRALVDETGRAWQAKGCVSYGPTGPEEMARVFRRSLYITRDMKAGEALGPENFRAIRPGLGLPTRHYDDLVGRRVKSDVKRGQPLSWHLIE